MYTLPTLSVFEGYWSVCLVSDSFNSQWMESLPPIDFMYALVHWNTCVYKYSNTD